MTPDIEEALGKPEDGSPSSESFVDHQYSTELYNFLRGTPKEFSYMLTPAARKDILHRVSWYLLSKDDRLAELVPLDERTGGAPREELQDELEVPIEYTEVRRGQPCGHVFKRGEGVYRCKNCSMDDTCVLCTRCFQATDHTGHDTSFSVNSGTGGCCDCGDPEAWKIPLRCRHHSSFDELDEVGLEPIISSAGAPFVPGYNNSECPVSVKQSIELTIAVVLEFILETFATSPISLAQQFDEASIMEDALNASMAINDREPQTKFAVVLWNDEVHSFQDVIDQCIEALLCSHMEAKKIAETVDSSGRDVLRVSTSIPELIDIATTMTNVSLSVSIRAARDVFREQLSASLLIWLRDLACCKFRPLARVFQGKINNEIRAEISHQLCLRWVAPYRNVYLADVLEKQYDFSLPDSDTGDECDNMDEDDPEDYDESIDDIEDRPRSDNNLDVGLLGTHDKDRNDLYSSAGYSELASFAQASAQRRPMMEIPASLPNNEQPGGARGLRRRRSESEDSLRHQGDQRASPRGFSYATDVQGGGSPPSMWLAENNGNAHAGSMPSTIHAAMGAAVDAMGMARNSLARIMQPSVSEGFPQHSLAQGAFPQATAQGPGLPPVASLPEAARHSHFLDPREANFVSVQSGQPQPLEVDLDMPCDMETALSIDRVLQGCGQQRLDWFLVFDLQLWKEVRSGLRELYMATLMLDTKYKMKIALTFARNYPRLSRAFLTQDRAPEHSVLLFSVQLFTAPTLSASLVDHHKFMYIILDVLKKFFVQPTPEILQRCGVILCDTESFRNRRYFHVFHDMRYLAGTPQVRNWVSSHHRFLSTYVGFIGLFQGMNPNRRALLEHVEFEADTWVNAFNVTLQVAKSCRQFAECYGISARDLFFVMRGTLRKLYRSVLLMAEENCSFIIRSVQAQGHLPHNISSANNVSGDINENIQLRFEMHTLSTLWGRHYEIVKYDVSLHPISFHHPLHWFMAELCQHVKHLTDERARDFGFATIRDMLFSAFNIDLDGVFETQSDAPASPNSQNAGRDNNSDSKAHPDRAAGNLYSMGPQEQLQAQRVLLRILDYPIRVCVVMAQIRAGLWVRNGYVIRSQSHHYREVSLRENTYDQDIVLIQFLMSIWPDPDHILMTLIDRFGLYDWLSGRPHSSPVYEPSHMHYMVEEFLNLLIVLISERHVALGKNALDLARREIVHACLSPISYSELAKRIPERLAEHTEFDNLLQQMANFRGPISVLDFGLYELKDEFLDEVEPYFIHYSRNQREEVEELLRERLKKRARKNGGEPDEVPAYIPPRLETVRFGPFQRIGLVLHTPLACQMLFYALFHATQNELLSEMMVDEALQLIVIALEDGKRGTVAREIGGPDVGNPGDIGHSADRGGLWKYALEQGYPSGRGAPLNLLGLVLTLGLKPEMKQWKPKLNYIYQLFREGGPRIVSCIDDYYANLEATPMGSRVLKSAMEETKAAERKKKAAQARQAAILAEFANRQHDFMAQYGDEYDDISDDENVAGDSNQEAPLSSSDKGKSADVSRVHKALWSTPSGACIVCQEECDGTKPFGILSLVQASRAVRDAPLADASQVVDILRLPGDLDSTIAESSVSVPQSPEESTLLNSTKNMAQTRTADNLGVINQVAPGAYGAPSGLKGFPVLYHQRGLAASTCGHLMHMRCFMQYCQGIEAKRQQQPTRNHPENPHRKEFLCPLCKSLGNVLLPSLPHSVEYDPLVIADRNPERFAQSAATDPDSGAAEFERWLSEEWLPFGATLDLAVRDQVISNSDESAANTAAAETRDKDISASNQSSGVHALPRDRLDEESGTASTSASAYMQAATSGTAAANAAGGGLANALRNPGNFSFNITENLAESIPRLDALLRGAQRLPSGINLQALLSRFLPQLGPGSLGLQSGADRLNLPISLYVRWLSGKQQIEQASQQNRRHIHDHAQSRRARGNGNGGGSSQCSTPDGSGNNPNALPNYPGAGSNSAFADRMTSEQEAKIREQMETYQYMYSRFYEVMQNVQRDNYVGLPSISMFGHLNDDKDELEASALHHGRTGTRAEAEHFDDEEFDGDGDGGDDDEIDPEEDEEEQEDEDDEEDDYMYPRTSGMIPGVAGFMPEPAAASLPQFLQNIVEHLRALSASGAGQDSLQSLANSSGIGLPPHVQGASKPWLYPFERAAGSLFAHTIELQELSQRGIRNPPVFDHEDSRNIPSGTLLDAVSEANAAFLHSLGKIPELHYRMVFGLEPDMPMRATNGVGAREADHVSPTQRLRTLLADAQSAVSPQTGVSGDVLARTRLEMIKDLGLALAPLSGSHVVASREALTEQSLWTTGAESMPLKPFLMQNTFALLTEASLSMVIPFGLDIWHVVRLFATAELIRACVAVGDSLLGEYTGAPKAVRIARHLPVDAIINHQHGPAAAPPPGGPSNGASLDRSSGHFMAATAATSAGTTAAANSCVPQPWVDAPEARDSKLLSLLSGGNDATLLKDSAPSIQSLVVWVIRQLQGNEGNEEALERLKAAANPVTVAKLVTTLMLPFLRRVALLFYLQYGVDIASEAPWLLSERQRASSSEDSQQVLSQSEPECARLLKLLHLPNIHQILDVRTQKNTVLLAEGWLRDLRSFRRRHKSPISLGAGYTMAIPMSMPTLYSLVELPDRFEVLFERSAKAFCPRCTGVPSDPALCLLCGGFVCAQSFCCEEDGIGECNMHMKTCGGTVGVYLLVKKCGLLLLHHDNGCFMSAPYLDQHGEVDLGLKRGRPLFINRSRYDEMKKLVLTQKIPVFVARKIDQAFDIGGWVSL
ncbi:E3 ubiquitin-protein ligase ubr1 [Coemansia sp. RSA 1721]|nr:E3 ubiquitin-protein ligase ubr1 [Coemansia sp. RSA 1721]